MVLAERENTFDFNVDGDGDGDDSARSLPKQQYSRLNDGQHRCGGKHWQTVRRQNHQRKKRQPFIATKLFCSVCGVRMNAWQH